MAADPLSVRLLGHVSAHRGRRRVAVTGAQRLAALSMLALRAGECVSSVDLIDGIWDEEAPDQARHALHVYVSELRKALGADAIETRRGGYRLCVDEEQVDALLFEQMAGRVNGGPWEQTRAELLDALALWRGPALDGAAVSATLRAAAARLEEERLAALERRFTAELELGCHDQILGELTSLVSAMPLRESLRSQLMLALFRSGRQADALAAYREGRARLAELGLEPGSELRNLERAILRQDPALAGGATAEAAPRGSASCLDDRTLEEVVAFAESWASDLRNFDAEAFAAVAERAGQLTSAFEHAIRTGAKEAAARLLTATCSTGSFAAGNRRRMPGRRRSWLFPATWRPCGSWRVRWPPASWRVSTATFAARSSSSSWRAGPPRTSSRPRSWPGSTPTLRTSSSGSVSSTSPMPMHDVRSS
jgi:DNA-binding SARP family transcriptional activator